VPGRVCRNTRVGGGAGRIGKEYHSVIAANCLCAGPDLHHLWDRRDTSARMDLSRGAQARLFSLRRPSVCRDAANDTVCDVCRGDALRFCVYRRMEMSKPMGSMDELVKLLGISSSPTTERLTEELGQLIQLKMGVAFEPHGRASETWEQIWILSLFTIPLYYQTKGDWVKDEKPGRHMYFRGRSAQIVIDKAKAFLQEVYEAKDKES